MLAEFIRNHRYAIVARVRAKAALRTVPPAPPEGLESGISLFLDQVVAVLDPAHSPTADIADTAARQGADLLRLGFTVGQVVNTYGSVCQAITEHAVESSAPV